MLETQSIKSVSELIELSIAPVFMLAGIAGFLNVFTGRLARIIDRIEKVNHYMQTRTSREKTEMDMMVEIRKKSLIKRMKNTNRAILLMCAAGLLVALVMVTMFLSAIFGFKDSIFISCLFIACMTSLIIALLLFSMEIFHTVSSAQMRTGLMP